MYTPEFRCWSNRQEFKNMPHLLLFLFPLWKKHCKQDLETSWKQRLVVMHTGFPEALFVDSAKFSSEQVMASLL